MAGDAREHHLVSPVDLPDEPIRGKHPLLWTSTTIAVAAILLACANAGTLAAWVDEKPVTETQQQVSEIAGEWKAAMDAYGVTAPREWLHGVWKRMQAARFGDEASDETR